MAPKNYRFHSLRFYNVTQMLAHQQRRYRSVFDESELGFLYCELTLYNKSFDEADWPFKCEFRIYDQAWNRHVATIPYEGTVAKGDNLVRIWGRRGAEALGSHWRAGQFRWEAWADGAQLGSAIVYVVNGGRVDSDKNPYLEPVSLRLYEAGKGDVNTSPARVLSQFDAAKTRYVNFEFVAANRRKGERWPLEMFFNYFFDTGELFGVAEVLRIIEPAEDEIVIRTGWGWEAPGAWPADRFRLEAVFMDHLVGSVPFQMGSAEVDADPSANPFPAASAAARPTPVPAQPESLEDILRPLDEMVGLADFKERVRALARYQDFVRRRKKLGISADPPPNLHAVFKGNPGTGKTTVAQRLGDIYRKLGLLTKGHVVTVDRSHIIGKYIGWTAPQTRDAITRARGGVLLVDEAYALFRSGDEDGKDFGREAIEILMQEMSDGPGDLAVICAGYPAEMSTFLASNPGFASRFGMIHDFPDFQPSELCEIAARTARARRLTLDEAARAYLMERFVRAYRGRSPSFGNARYVHDVLRAATQNLAARMWGRPDDAPGEAELSTIRVEDLRPALEGRIASVVDDGLLEACRAELSALVGLDQIKREVEELIVLARAYREDGKDASALLKHAVLTGNPGTGKTTVARILGRTYKALGLLERGHLVECDRSDLVARYTGHTAFRTARVLDEAMGGILFIDEAYALARDAGDRGFGAEAIETLIKRMEDSRGRFAVLVAGYTELMEGFLDVNPGLRSRFERVFHFPDYTAAELLQIALGLVGAAGLQVDAGGRQALEGQCAALRSRANAWFGNARDARKLVEAARWHQELRLARMPHASRTPEARRTLLAEDIGAAVLPEPGKTPGSGAYL